MRQQNKSIGRALMALAFATCILLQACNNNTTTNADKKESDSTAMAGKKTGDIPELKPTTPKPNWATDIDDNMQVVIDKLGSYGDPPIESVDAPKARTLHTPTDAVMDVMKENNIPMPAPQVDTMGKEIPVDGGTIHARVYTPKNGNGSFPLIVYYHGGGWVIATIDTYDAGAKGLAEQTGAVVVSVEYRKGPEHKFPTAHNDAFAAYQWAVQNAASLKADPKMVAVAGVSAGGNMACIVSMMARDKGVQMPVRQVLVYPVAGSDMNSESYQKYAMAKPLNKAMMMWFAKNYLGDTTKAKDPLQTEGKQLSDKLKDAGVDVNYKLYNGVTHEFFGMATLLQDAKDAQALAASDLKQSFGK